MRDDAVWLTTQQLVERLKGVGITDVSDTTLAHWRRSRLLDRNVDQEVAPYRGSTVFHPPDTFDRLIAIRRFLKQKNDLAWVGRQLWWEGFPIDEEVWRPALIETAQRYDPVLKWVRDRLAQEIDGDDNLDDELERPVLADQAAREFKLNILSSRIIGRVPNDQLAPVLRIILHAAGGAEPEYEVDAGEQPQDFPLLIKAMGLARSETDVLANERFTFTAAIRPVLSDIAGAIRSGSLSDAATAVGWELAAARDDFRRGIEICVMLYRATRWLYGNGAFGLRFANWCAAKAPSDVVRVMLFIWVLMRRSGHELLASEEIEQLHRRTREVSALLSRIEAIYEADRIGAKILSRKQLRRALSGEISLDLFVERLECARLAIDGAGFGSVRFGASS